MKCRSCSWPESQVVDTRAAKGETQVRRRRECPRCHRRWTTFEREERGSSTFDKPQLIVGEGTTNSSQAPPLIVANPPTNSVGGVGGGVSSVRDGSQSDPDLLTQVDLEADSVSSPIRARARNKPDASPHFSPMLGCFVVQWEARYGDKYMFEPRDFAQLKAMIRKHPETIERWPEMVTRYLDNAFWAEKRHPLNCLVTRPVEFAGETSRQSRFSKTTQATMRGMGAFIANGQRGAK